MIGRFIAIICVVASLIGCAKRVEFDCTPDDPYDLDSGYDCPNWGK